MTNQTRTNDLTGIDTANGLAPLNGPKTAPLDLDFSFAASFEVDFITMLDLRRMEFVQSIYVDNSANNSILNLTSGVSSQKLSIPPNSQGFYAFFLTRENSRFTAACVNREISVRIHLCNYPNANEIWYPSSTQGSGDIGTDYSVSQPALGAALLATIPVNAARKFFEYQNQSANQHQVVMDDGAGAKLSIVLIAAAGANQPGGSYTNNVERGRVRIYGTAADQIYLREW